MKATRAPTLRKGYGGFCPLTTGPSGIIGGGGGHVERKHWSDLDPQKFFAYVKQRKPLLISTSGLEGPLKLLFGLRGASAAWSLPGAEGMRAMKNSGATDCEVVVERRSAKTSNWDLVTIA